MSVKTIFKVLLGTVMLIVISSVMVELFNISITGMQIRQMTRMSARQACILFTQETYKTDAKNGSANVQSIKNCDGGEYISGNFYPNTNAQNIWKSIYTSNNFKNFCNNTVGLDKYSDLILLQRAANSNGNVGLPSPPSWDASDSEIAEYNKATTAQLYFDNLYTTVNLGIPYMDDEIVNKMFRWNLAMILSNCTSDSIQMDEDGNYFINYKGFRCYAQAAEITKYDYTVCDLGTSEGRIKFNNLTGMSASKVGSNAGLGLDGIESDNKCVTVVGIEYRMPVSYIGITRIKNIFNFVWNNEVKGFNGDDAGITNKESWAEESLSQVGTNAGGIQYLKSGGTFGNNTLPSTGRLIYTLVR